MKLLSIQIIYLMVGVCCGDGSDNNETIWNPRFVPPVVPNDYIQRAESQGESQLSKINQKLALCNGINILEITILQLQSAYQNGSLTARQVVKCYLKRIHEMNPYLNAVIETNPDALKIADQLDLRRRQGKSYGVLHGIPVLLKDSMGTNDKMETCSGALALIGLKPKEDSVVAQLLRRAGAILLGKSNLSELSNFRASDMPNGWSGRGGQTHNAYIIPADPKGSSSGSAVAVAANLAPVALGSDTGGSIIHPSAAASIVGLKSTLKRVSTRGTIGIAFSQDVIGPIARTVEDAAIVFSVISNNGFRATCFNQKTSLKNCISAGNKFRLGVLRNPHWTSENIRERLPQLELALKHLRSINGMTVIDPVSQVYPSLLESVTPKSTGIVCLHEFKYLINKYLKENVSRESSHLSISEVTNLNDIIKYNVEFPPLEGYDQETLLRAQATNGLANKTYIWNREKNRVNAEVYLSSILKFYNLDAIVLPTDRASTAIPSVAGYPHITLPAGFRVNGLPFGISFFGGPNSEEKLLIIAGALEKVLDARRPSKFYDLHL